MHALHVISEDNARDNTVNQRIRFPQHGFVNNRVDRLDSDRWPDQFLTARWTAAVLKSSQNSSPKTSASAGNILENLAKMDSLGTEVGQKMRVSAH